MLWFRVWGQGDVGMGREGLNPEDCEVKTRILQQYKQGMQRIRHPPLLLPTALALLGLEAGHTQKPTRSSHPFFFSFAAGSKAVLVAYSVVIYMVLVSYTRYVEFLFP